MSKLIEPRTLRGFRDYPPALMISRERVLDTARSVYRRYGYAPIDTPALEYAEILLGKGGEESDKLIYRFRDHGDRDVALRFDLTVPFARFAAQNIPSLGTPFKRYAMGPVWRGENTGHGRYREFWQCDFDTIGTTSNASDIEVALVIHDLFVALGFSEFEIRVNNRQILNGVLDTLGISHQSVAILRALDKLLKVGQEKVIEEMVREAGIEAKSAEKVLMLTTMQKTNAEVLDVVESEYGSNPQASEGCKKLRELLTVAASVGVPESRLRVDLSIARGLDYYTGMIYETFLTGSYADEKGTVQRLSQFGSVCSGGRYDNLASLYTKQALPGVGASLGVDRLIAAMEASQHPWMKSGSSPAQVLILQFDATRLQEYQVLAAKLRAANIAVELYPDAKKPKQQLEYADKRGIPLAVIAGPEEFLRDEWQVKILSTREQIAVPNREIVQVVTKHLTP